jgi:predicted acetyltransferase
MITNHELQIQIIKGKLNDKPLFRNLMQFYKYDTSDFTLEDPNSFGQFDYNYLDHYWTEAGIQKVARTAYLIKVNEQLAGFALVNNFNLSLNTENGTRNIAEFFIMKKWRRHGVGKYAACFIFDTFDGQWEVKQEPENKAAHRFWQIVIDEYTNGSYTRVESQLPEWDGPVIYFHSNKAKEKVI